MKYLYIALLLMFSQTASAQHTCIMIGDSIMSFAGVDTVGGVSPHSDKMAAASARGGSTARREQGPSRKTTTNTQCWALGGV